MKAAIARLGLALILGCCVVSASFAQDISSDVGRLTPGTIIVYKNSDGPSFRHVVRGKDAKGYRIDVFDGPKEGGQDKSTYWVDAQGNLLRFVWADGREVTYRPHNCMRTLGTCKFQERRPGEPNKNRVLETVLTDDGFSATEKDAATGQPLRTSGVTLGANGLNVRGWFQLDGERRIDLKIVKIKSPS